jgi:cell division protein FtsB
MKTRTLLLLFVVLCLGLAAAVWLGPVYQQSRATRESIARLQANLARQAQEIERLNRELRELRTDYRAIERVARENFGMCRPGEEIYHFEDPPAAGKAPATPAPAPGAAPGPAQAP